MKRINAPPLDRFIYLMTHTLDNGSWVTHYGGHIAGYYYGIMRGETGKLIQVISHNIK